MRKAFFTNRTTVSRYLPAPTTRFVRLCPTPGWDTQTLLPYGKNSTRYARKGSRLNLSEKEKFHMRMIKVWIDEEIYEDFKEEAEQKI